MSHQWFGAHPVVTLDFLVPGEGYDRPYLAKRWNYADWHAIGRGIVTPAGQKLIVLFVTKEKQHSLVQYEDHFEGDTLFMEGERSVDSGNNRLRRAEVAGDQIVLFYRERHHSPFIYYGPIELEQVEDKSERATFVFRTQRSDAIATNALATEAEAHGEAAYVADAEGRQRSRQHVEYERSRRNRAEAIRIHGTTCKGCGFDFNAVYGADLARDYVEVHHLESVTTGVRSIDPRTDLVPLCANCHAMVHRRRGEILPLEELHLRLRKQGGREPRRE